MLTRNALAQIERSLRTAQVLSVYVDRSSPESVRGDVWRHQLDQLVIDAREGLAGPRSEEETFERCVDQLYTALSRPATRPGARGWLGLFHAGSDPFVESLPVQMPMLVSWGTGVRVAPCIRTLKQHVPAVVALVDARSAALYVYGGGVLDEVGRIHSPRRSSPFHHLTDAPADERATGVGEGTPQGADAVMQEAVTTALVDDLVDQLELLAGSRAWILVGGIAEIAARVVRAMPEFLQRRTRRLLGVEAHASPAELREATERVVTAASRERDLKLVHQLLDREAAGGRGVSGLAGTLAALRGRAVDRFFLTGRFIREHPAEAEALTRWALEQEAELEYVSAAAAERLDEAGGTGALLRFVPLPGESPRMLRPPGPPTTRRAPPAARR